MTSTHRTRMGGRSRRFALGVATLVVAGCAAAGPSAPAASVPVLVTPAQSVAASPAAVATATAQPTPQPLPTALTRPTDLPKDGACEAGRPCLGLITPGSHHSQLFVPGFAFTMSAKGWENLAMTPGEVGLLALDAPGDEIVFFTQFKLTKPDGSLDFSAPLTVDGITGWFAANQSLTVGPATDVTTGGLHGKRMTFTVSPTATAHLVGCPAQVCLDVIRAQSQTWEYEWGVASSERERVDVLTAKDGVVLIFVDSLDGTTFDALTKRADAILATVKFDK